MFLFLFSVFFSCSPFNLIPSSVCRSPSPFHANTVHFIFEQNLLIFIAIVNFNPLANSVVWLASTSIRNRMRSAVNEPRRKMKQKKKRLKIVIDSHRSLFLCAEMWLNLLKQLLFLLLCIAVRTVFFVSFSSLSLCSYLFGILCVFCLCLSFSCERRTPFSSAAFRIAMFVV